MGKNNRQTQTTSTSQRNTAGLDPASQAYVDGMRQQAQGAAGMMGTLGPLTAGVDPNFTQGLAGLNRDLSGLGPDLSQYMTNLGLGGGGSVSNLDLNGMRQALPENLGNMDFSAGRINTNRFADFMNPYEQSVVESMYATGDRQRQAAMNAAAQQATAAGAFGGSRGEILQAEGIRNVNQDEAAQIAALRNQGFQQAQNLAASEWQTQGQLGLQAAIAQQQGQIAAAGLQLQGDLGFAGLGLQQNQMNMGNELQRLGLGVQQGLGFANLQQSQDFQRAAMQMQQAQGQMQAGDYLRGIEQQRLMEPVLRAQLGQQFLQGGLGPTGSVSTQTGNTTQTQEQQQGWGTTLSNIAGIGAAMYGGGLFGAIGNMFGGGGGGGGFQPGGSGFTGGLQPGGGPGVFGAPPAFNPAMAPVSYWR